MRKAAEELRPVAATQPLDVELEPARDPDIKLPTRGGSSDAATPDILSHRCWPQGKSGGDLTVEFFGINDLSRRPANDTARCVPFDRLIGKKERSKLTGYSAGHLDKMVRRGQFPPPFKLANNGKVRWWLSDVIAWLNRRAEFGGLSNFQAADIAPAPATEVTFELARLPPSTNSLFFNRPGKGRSKTFPYREWLTGEGWNLTSQKIKPILGPVALHITLPDLPGRAPDIDNALKALIDLLVQQRIIQADDKRVLRAVSVQWDNSISTVRIRVRPLGDKPNKPSSPKVG